MNIIFNRLMRLTGEKSFKDLQSINVIVFGIGGVGSWCAESLVRSGVQNLTIVDSDIVCITNINRQLQATTKSVGEVKVNALGKRLKDINPDLNLTKIEKFYNKDSQSEFNLNNYDYVIDAIDSLSAKVDLIEQALNSDTTLFSSMGAASKIDPTRVRVEQIWKTYGCPLARLVRTRLKKRRTKKKKFTCVFSDEVLPIQPVEEIKEITCDCPKKEACGELFVEHSAKQQINGSITHITGLFGFTLAGLVVKDVMSKNK